MHYYCKLLLFSFFLVHKQKTKANGNMLRRKSFVAVWGITINLPKLAVLGIVFTYIIPERYLFLLPYLGPVNGSLSLVIAHRKITKARFWLISLHWQELFGTNPFLCESFCYWKGSKAIACCPASSHKK